MSRLSIKCEILSGGMACGSICMPRTAAREAETAQPASKEPKAEIKRFKQQVESLVDDLAQAVSQLDAESMAAEADVIRAHILMLKDPEFHSRVGETIDRMRFAAESAVEHVLSGMVDLFERSDNVVLSERSADLRDLAAQLRAKLSMQRPDLLPEMMDCAVDPILALPELLPSLVLKARGGNIRGFVVERGTALSHGAILAKSFGIPALRLPPGELRNLAHGMKVFLDGELGELLVEPDGEDLGRLSSVSVGVEGESLPVHPHIRLWISVVDPSQLEHYDWRGIEGVGLYRTETLFMRRADDFPSEAEQIEVYRHFMNLGGGRPLTIRTADLGADKMVPYMSLGPQDNPYLGLRGHRLFKFHPEIIITQLRAILRAGEGYGYLRILYPMLESLEQWNTMQRFLHQAIQSLEDEGLPHLRKFQQGVLIEVPSAVWDFPRLVAAADFTSVGTNDLVQYLFAVERNNANVASYYQPEHPVVLQVLKSLADQSRRAGKRMSICGEIASDPLLLPLLAGLGIEDLSVNIGVVPLLRRRLQMLDVDICREVSQVCLEAATTEEVRIWLGKCVVETSRPPHSLRQDQAADPVCKMVVAVRGNPFTIARGDTRYYFCSRKCMLKFSQPAAPAASVGRRE